MNRISRLFEEDNLGNIRALVRRVGSDKLRKYNYNEYGGVRWRTLYPIIRLLIEPDIASSFIKMAEVKLGHG